MYFMNLIAVENQLLMKYIKNIITFSSFRLSKYRYM